MMYYQYFFAVRQLRKWYFKAREIAIHSLIEEEYIKKTHAVENILFERAKEIEKNFPNCSYDGYSATASLIMGTSEKTIKETYDVLCGRKKIYPFKNAPEFIKELAKRVQAFNFETYHVFSSTMLNYLYDICIPSVADGEQADEFEYSLKYIEFVRKKLDIFIDKYESYLSEEIIDKIFKIFDFSDYLNELERKLAGCGKIDNWLICFVYECNCNFKRFFSKEKGIKVEPKNLEQLKKFIVGEYEF